MSEIKILPAALPRTRMRWEWGRVRWKSRWQKESKMRMRVSEIIIIKESHRLLESVSDKTRVHLRRRWGERRRRVIRDLLTGAKHDFITTVHQSRTASFKPQLQKGAISKRNTIKGAPLLLLTMQWIASVKLYFHRNCTVSSDYSNILALIPQARHRLLRDFSWAELTKHWMKITLLSERRIKIM